MQNNKWNIALGLLKADGLRPSPEFLDLTEKEKRGELTTDDIRQILNRKYGMKGKNHEPQNHKANFDHSHNW